MSEPVIPNSPEDEDDLLAAEYVLGVLSLPDRARAEARLRQDNSFAARVSAWEIHLEGLNDDYAEVAAPDLMPAIEARLFPKAEIRQAGWRGNWRGNWFAGVLGLGLATLSAVVLAAFLLFNPAAPGFTAMLTAEASDLRYEARVEGESITLVQLAGAATEPGKVRELWMIIGDAPPISLGLLTAQSVTLAAIGPADGVVLAISLEPTGGSTTGAPTGPVLVVGTLSTT